MADSGPVNVWPDIGAASEARLAWLSTDGSGNALFVSSSSNEMIYVGSSSSTAVFAMSTAQFATTVRLLDKSGVFIWEG